MGCGAGVMAGESRTRAVGALGLRVCVCVCVGMGMGMGVGGGVGDHQDQDGKRQERQETRDKQPGERGGKLCHLYSLYVLLTLPVVIQYRCGPPTRKSAACAGLGDSVDSWQRQIRPGKGREGDGSWALAAPGILCGRTREKKEAAPFPLRYHGRLPPNTARAEPAWTGMSEQPGAYTAPFPAQLPYVPYRILYSVPQCTAYFSSLQMICAAGID